MTSLLQEDEKADFGNPEYWETVYEASSGNYEWYLDWNFLHEKLGDICKNKEIVLNIGCGNSSMPYDMKDYFKSIYNIDISKSVIDKMKEKYSNEKNLIWEQMDCAKLNYEDEFFDVIFDKATIDAILCADDYKDLTHSTILECSRTLKTSGLLVVLTCGLFVPNITNSVFIGNKLNWELLKTSEFNNPTNEKQMIHLYVFKKLPQSKCQDEEIDKSFVFDPNEYVISKLLEEYEKEAL